MESRQDPSQPLAEKDDVFSQQLDNAVEALRNDFVSGARQMADAALTNFSSLFDAARQTEKSKEDLWRRAVFAVQELSSARPSMNAAVCSCLLRALDGIANAWDEVIVGEMGVDRLVGLATNVIEGMLKERKEAGVRLGKNFVGYIEEHLKRNEGSLTLLTLSNSSTIHTTLLTLLTTLPGLNVTLHILESRPRCEGADLASQLLSSLPNASQSRQHIRIFPDCAVHPALRGVDLVLLGADRISPEGDVSNKIGSLTIATMAEIAKVKVVAVSEIDKIVAVNGEKEVEEAERHPASELMGAWSEETRKGMQEKIKNGTVEVYGEWFEWVPARYVDAYVTDSGVLSNGDVEKFSRKVGELREKILG